MLSEKFVAGISVVAAIVSIVANIAMIVDFWEKRLRKIENEADRG